MTMTNEETHIIRIFRRETEFAGMAISEYDLAHGLKIRRGRGAKAERWNLSPRDLAEMTILIDADRANHYLETGEL